MTSQGTIALGVMLSGVGIWGATGEWWAACLAWGAMLLVMGFLWWIE